MEMELGERKVIIIDYYIKQIIDHFRPNLKGFGSGWKQPKARTSLICFSRRI